jgi:2-methylcitrate dehydratase PrpD
MNARPDASAASSAPAPPLPGSASATASVPTLSHRLASFAVGFEPAAMPDDLVALAKAWILDAIGIAFASTRFEFAERCAAGLGSLAAPGEHVVIGRRERWSSRDAALLNGLLIHGLDYDDTHPGSVVHASASALPAVLAAGRQHGASGARALAAYLLAVEADARIGAHAGGWWQKVGFHPTGVVGVFGAALAAGYLQRADEPASANALGLALSMASGSMEFLDEGSWNKRFHPGWAAASGLTAAALAVHGFQAPSRAFEGRFGLYSTYLGAHAPASGDPFDDLGSRWEARTVAVKPYPVCHFSHACGDAALALQAEHGFAAEDVVRIVARLHRNQMPVVCEPAAAKRRPRSEYDAKFSLPYFVAACLVRGRFTLDELEPGSLEDPRILALCERVSCEHDDESAFPQYFSGAVEIELRDGRRFARRERIHRGADARPLSPAEIERKFYDNATRAVSRAHAERVREAVASLERAPDLVELCEALGA